MTALQWGEWMKISSKQRQAASAKLGVAACAIAITIASADGAATAPISAAEAERMVAASPQRERHRAWSICTDNMAAMVIPQAADIAKLRSMLELGCSDEESRLTGALVAAYGYDRGNGAMTALKRAADARFQDQIVKRSQPAKQPGVVETTPEGWQIRRVTGGCMAVLSRRNSLNAGSKGVALQGTTGKWKIDFVVVGSERDMLDTAIKQSFAVKAITSAGGNSKTVPLTLKPQLIDNGIYYEADADEALIGRFVGAESVQIMLPSFGSGSWPSVYDVRGLQDAWQSLQRCAADS